MMGLTKCIRGTVTARALATLYQRPVELFTSTNGPQRFGRAWLPSTGAYDGR
jgi:hypothetical protein